jgi:inner membrane protein
MDLITQGILGAAVGQIGFQRTLGRKALIYGALIGILPDADVLVRFSSDMCAEMLHHRGITHSLFFAPIVAPIMGWVCNKPHKQQLLTTWIGLWFWALITHPLLDVFTVYGTQLLSPISNHRFSFCAVPIIDPTYSLPLLLSVIIGCFIKENPRISQTITAIMLLLTTSYLFLGIAMHDKAIAHVRNYENFKTERTEAFTTMFSIFYRRIVVEDDQQFHIGFLNTLDPQPIKWQSFNKGKISEEFFLKRELKIFYWFADNWVLPIHDDSSITLRDIRFGVDEQCILGYWGIKISSKKISWERFPADISLANIKKLLHAIFCHKAN